MTLSIPFDIPILIHQKLEQYLDDMFNLSGQKFLECINTPEESKDLKIPLKVYTYLLHNNKLIYTGEGHFTITDNEIREANSGLQLKMHTWSQVKAELCLFSKITIIWQGIYLNSHDRMSPWQLPISIIENNFLFTRHECNARIPMLIQNSEGAIQHIQEELSRFPIPEKFLPDIKQYIEEYNSN